MGREGAGEMGTPQNSCSQPYPFQIPTPIPPTPPCPPQFRCGKVRWVPPQVLTPSPASPRCPPEFGWEGVKRDIPSNPRYTPALFHPNSGEERTN